MTLTKEDTAGEYAFYGGTFAVTAAQVNSTTFDISAVNNGTTVKSPFHKIVKFGLSSTDGEGDHGGSPSNTISSTTTARTSMTTTHPGIIETSSRSSTTTASSTSAVVSSWTNWSQPALSVTNEPEYPTHGPKGSHRPCGPDEGCDVADWATESFWVVPIPGPLSHTKPAGVCSDKPVLGGDLAGTEAGVSGAFTKTGALPVAPTEVTTLDSQASGVGSKPTAPSSPVSPFTGDASHLPVGFAAAAGIVCALVA